MHELSHLSGGQTSSHVCPQVGTTTVQSVYTCVQCTGNHCTPWAPAEILVRGGGKPKNTD